MNRGKISFIVSVLVFSIITLLPASDAFCYGVEYDYYVYATGSDGIPVYDDDGLVGQAQLYDSHIKTGDPDAGNYGSSTITRTFTPAR